MANLFILIIFWVCYTYVELIVIWYLVCMSGDAAYIWRSNTCHSSSVRVFPVHRWLQPHVIRQVKSQHRWLPTTAEFPASEPRTGGDANAGGRQPAQLDCHECVQQPVCCSVWLNGYSQRGSAQRHNIDVCDCRHIRLYGVKSVHRCITAGSCWESGIIVNTWQSGQWRSVYFHFCLFCADLN